MNLNQNYWFAPFRFQDYFLTKIMAFKYFHTLENQYLKYHFNLRINDKRMSSLALLFHLSHLRPFD